MAVSVCTGTCAVRHKEWSEVGLSESTEIPDGLPVLLSLSCSGRVKDSSDSNARDLLGLALGNTELKLLLAVVLISNTAANCR